ncbi:hypothetical protein ACSHDS_000718 [Vibrio alginolyticus]
MTAFNKVFIVTPNVNDFAMLQESPLEMSLQVTASKPIQLYGESVKASWKSIDIEWLDVMGEKPLPRPDMQHGDLLLLLYPLLLRISSMC